MESLESLLKHPKFKKLHDTAQAGRTAFLGHWMPLLTIPVGAEDYVKTLNEQTLAELWFGAVVLSEGVGYWTTTVTTQANPLWQPMWEGETHTVKSPTSGKKVVLQKYICLLEYDFTEAWASYQKSRELESTTGNKTYFDEWYRPHRPVTVADIENTMKSKQFVQESLDSSISTE